MSEPRVGENAEVVSGPHQGIAGRVVYVREYSQDGREPEPYAIVEYMGKNCFDESYVDQVSVPVRRLKPLR